MPSQEERKSWQFTFPHTNDGLYASPEQAAAYTEGLPAGASADTDGEDGCRGSNAPPLPGAYYGQLTKVGAAQMRAAGRAIVREYGHALGLLDDDAAEGEEHEGGPAFKIPPSKAGEIYVRSTYVTRCVHSTQNLLAGLFGIDFDKGVGRGSASQVVRSFRSTPKTGGDPMSSQWQLVQRQVK